MAGRARRHGKHRELRIWAIVQALDLRTGSANRVAVGGACVGQRVRCKRAVAPTGSFHRVTHRARSISTGRSPTCREVCGACRNTGLRNVASFDLLRWRRRSSTRATLRARYSWCSPPPSSLGMNQLLGPTSCGEWRAGPWSGSRNQRSSSSGLAGWSSLRGRCSPGSSFSLRPPGSRSLGSASGSTGWSH